jgi:hypothetical protein
MKFFIMVGRCLLTWNFSFVNSKHFEKTKACPNLLIPHLSSCHLCIFHLILKSYKSSKKAWEKQPCKNFAGVSVVSYLTIAQCIISTISYSTLLLMSECAHILTPSFERTHNAMTTRLTMRS